MASKSPSASPCQDILLLLPVFNDWEPALSLLYQLDKQVEEIPFRTSVLFVDDGSSQPPPVELPKPLAALQNIHILKLRRNLGHQKSIAIGLAYIDSHFPKTHVLILDADGEDKPEDIPRLTAQAVAEGFQNIVFASRLRRSEGITFTFFYKLYQLLHYLLTGLKVKVGNFSLLPSHFLPALVVSPELWIHYAACVMRLRLPLSYVPTSRGERIGGKSQMNFVQLISHGLGAMSVYNERIGVRLLIASSILGGSCFLLIGVAICIRLFTTLAIPGWATYVTGLLIIVMLQIFMLSMFFTFLILANHGRYAILPLRDHGLYVQSLIQLPHTPSQEQTPQPISPQHQNL